MPEQADSVRTWLSIEEAAAQLQVHHNTVRRAIRLKELKAYKLGGIWRIEKVDLQEYKERQSNISSRAA